MVGHARLGVEEGVGLSVVCYSVNTVDRVSRETEIMQLTSNVVKSQCVSLKSREVHFIICHFCVQFVCVSCCLC